MPTPSASAAQAGFPGNPDAVNASAQVNQFLGTHGITPVYGGNQIVNPSSPSTTVQNEFLWISPATESTIPGIGLLDNDFDQPFTLPVGQTAIGRAEVALLPVGSAADVQVTLCPDNGSGAPNTASPLASTVIPAAWITNLGAPDGLDTAGPIATAKHNTLLGGLLSTYNWTQPAVGPSGAGSYATPVTSGNYAILLGGALGATNTPVGAVATLQYLGDQTLSGPIPQPPLPQGAWYGMATATDSMIMYAGGTNGASFYNTVWTASWDPNTGTVGAWSAQTALPLGLIQGAAASWGDTVYVVGGSTSLLSAQAVPNVWYASAINGQITQWLAAPPLPQPLQCAFAGVVGNWLIVAGGQTVTDVASTSVYYAPINTDGTLGSWRIGPPLPTPVYALNAQWNMVTTDTALIVFSGLEAGSTSTTYAQTLAVDASGVGGWQAQQFFSQSLQCVVFATGDPGAWDLFALGGSNYFATTFSPVPLVSVPLPAAGLTAGATYHLVVHQIGGDLNNYCQLGEVGDSSSQWNYSPSGSGGPWVANTRRSIMANLYDQTPTGSVLHAWVDPNAVGLAAEATTYVHDSTGRLLGECIATALVTQPAEPPAFVPSVAVLGYAGDGGMPTSVTQLA